MHKIITVIIFIIFAIGSPCIASAMSYSIGYKIDDSGDSHPHSISMTGKIEVGDYEKLLSFIRANPTEAVFAFAVTNIQSNGGDLIEAIKIGKLLKSLRARVFAEKCVSACFFIYVMTPTHYTKGKDNSNGRTRNINALGVHRPYFDKVHFSKLNTKQADEKYEQLEKNARDILKSSNVPQNLIDKMFSVSSSDVYFLSPDEVAQLGMFHPSFEELVIAKCGDGNGDEELITAWWRCINKFEFRETLEGVNIIMKDLKNPKWENLNKFFAKQFAKGE